MKLKKPWIWYIVTKKKKTQEVKSRRSEAMLTNKENTSLWNVVFFFAADLFETQTETLYNKES